MRAPRGCVWATPTRDCYVMFCAEAGCQIEQGLDRVAVTSVTRLGYRCDGELRQESWPSGCRGRPSAARGASGQDEDSDTGATASGCEDDRSAAKQQRRWERGRPGSGRDRPFVVAVWLQRSAGAALENPDVVRISVSASTLSHGLSSGCSRYRPCGAAGASPPKPRALKRRWPGTSHPTQPCRPPNRRTAHRSSDPPTVPTATPCRRRR